MEKSTSNSKGIDPMLILGKAVDMSVSMRGGDFPLSAMPMKIQRIVREANDCYGFRWIILPELCSWLSVLASVTPISPG